MKGTSSHKGVRYSVSGLHHSVSVGMPFGMKMVYLCIGLTDFNSRQHVCLGGLKEICLLSVCTISFCSAILLDG
jgi:hypothetical protein